ncbi:alpha-ketoglutarate-dependent dioxygenase AlkB [Pseudomonas sp. S25]|uniref:Alpha-ketoglutarate-dependent dioxygenase AlkB n=1 Tax=Pseudomonas maioricensis TaxID=1766623 RepID=A0ABS9ZLN4_9PSED|nr:DNA oxidative demethylase AlkB [Pseudomonas sp. S25]MCI8211484.1 alpha-ketoglutarate-dependent dioxygenase AlkB [Pseudomonas sp. S25]
MKRESTTPTTFDLFAEEPAPSSGTEQIGPCSWVLRGLALPEVDTLLAALEDILIRAPFRHMVTPGGFTMSAALSSCGSFGWMTDRSGYRYTPTDPQSGLPWPDIPTGFMMLAQRAAHKCGFNGFVPDACLINQYIPGAKMSLHQDKDEKHYEWPVVSVSLGLPAIFLFGGDQRHDKPQRIPLMHGDVVVWGGEDRLRFHGVLPIKPGHHPLLGEQRINFTFRRAL